MVYKGRGIGDFLKGLGFDLGIWAALIKRVLIIIGTMLLSGLISVILFVKPGILMGWW